MAENYYGNVPAGYEPEVCGVGNGRHTCFEKPNHSGKHKCGRNHSSMEILLGCTFEWEDKDGTKT